MSFDTENIQNSPILDTDKNSFSSSVETASYGLEPVTDNFSRETQLDSISEHPLPESIEPLPLTSSDTDELVFISSAVEDSQTLVDNISGAKVVLLDSSQDELVQISQQLTNYRDLDAVHIVSHGESGQLSFGDTKLNADTLPEYVHLLEDWGNSLSAEADLLLYGCDVSSGGSGNAFIQQVSQITNADVAASVDDTGISGDWSLETKVGEIEATSVFEDSIASAYQHDLADASGSVSESFGSGGGSSEDNSANVGGGGDVNIGLNNDLDSDGDDDDEDNNAGDGGDASFTGAEFFDDNFYLRQNPDVAEAGVDPVKHYDEFGWKEGRDPNKIFDTSFYLEQNPDVADAGINPLEHYYKNRDTDEIQRFPNKVNQSFGTAEASLVATSDLSGIKYEEFKNTARENETAFLPAVAVPFIIIEGTKILAITAASLGSIIAANNIRELLEESDTEIFVRDGVDTSIPPFDLGETTRIADLKNVPRGDDFLEDIIDGKFEFPDAEEGDAGAYFLPIEEVPDSPIGKTTKLSEKFLEDRGVDAEDLKAGVVGDAGGQFDIYKDKDDNLWAVRKGDKAEESDLWLDNLDNY